MYPPSKRVAIPAFRLDAHAGEQRPLVLTRSEVAKMCSVSVQTIDVRVRKGILPGTIAGTRRWSRTAIERRLAGENASQLTTDQSSPFEQWKRHRAC